jgi:hypothetical protein
MDCPGGLTIRYGAVDRNIDPLAPVTVMLIGALVMLPPVVDTVRVVEPEPVTDGGSKLVVAPLGRPEAENCTVSVKPLIGWTEIVY